MVYFWPVTDVELKPQGLSVSGIQKSFRLSWYESDVFSYHQRADD